MDLILWAAIISVGLNLLLFLPAYFFRTDRLTDISYALTFIILAVFGYLNSSMTADQMVLLIMVLVWAVRLGTFLFTRINRNKKDSRFDQMRSRWWSFLRFWLFQGVTAFIVSLAALAAWQQPFGEINLLSYIGWLIFGLGFTIEAVADYQKSAFKKQKSQQPWIDSGFWRISRHPNYLGEIMVWTGVYLFAFPSLSPVWRLLGLASPLYITLTLLFFSGVPLLEKSADRKWGQKAAYRRYKHDVPLLVPTAASLERLTK